MRQSVLVRVNPNADGNWRKAQIEMLDYGVTSELFRLLVAQGEIKRSVGAEGLGMNAGVPMGGQTHPLADAAREEDTRIRLVWTNLNQPAARQVASSLKLVQ